MQSSKEINKKTFLNYFSKDDEMTIFDVGTYDGKDSLEFLDVFPNSNIFSFEADDRSIKTFKNVVKDERINLIETALSDVDGTIEFYKSDSETRRHYDFEDSWSASSSIKKPLRHLDVFPDVTFYKPIKVKSKRLDTWIKTEKNINNIDIMWVDVNGGENEFLNGAYDTIVKRVKFLYMEFCGVDDKKLYENSFTHTDIKDKLGNFKELGVYNFMGNFGNVLLKNKDI